ncbi:LysR substrate-binding domain-containing protein [Roseococcus pinisoli]|uniref:LysR substrate-binding domain-containing protein n=1 Tax=Roseococcus pinisoli TaxID=2835040 RepID=UPI0020BDE9A6|nr:LysR substrate-binding domain-containing protein [Roseococcus pinisoli]
MDLTFRQLEIVRAVCREGSVTQAAALLGISQPAVSMTLREASSITGFPLFLRFQGRLRPTAEMRLLLAELDRLFDGVGRVNRLVEDMRHTGVGTVHLASTPALADSLVPAAMVRFRELRPRVRVSVQAMDNLGVLDAVTRERVNLGLVLTPIETRDLRRMELCRSELICVVRPDHPLAERGQVSLEEIDPWPLISFDDNLPLGHLVKQHHRATGRPRRIALEVNQSSVACAMVRAGLGVAIIDPFALSDGEGRGVVALRLTPSMPIGVLAVMVGDAPPSRLTLLFLAHLRRAAEAFMSPRGESETTLPSLAAGLQLSEKGGLR